MIERIRTASPRRQDPLARVRLGTANEPTKNIHVSLLISSLKGQYERARSGSTISTARSVRHTISRPMLHSDFQRRE